MMETVKKTLKDNGWFLIALAAILLFNLRFDTCYIKTGSMEPELPVGTIVILDPYGTPKIGDIFAYQNGGNVVVHRIVSSGEEGYVFKGDANAYADVSEVTESRLAGKAVLAFRFLAPLMKFLKLV